MDFHFSAAATPHTYLICIFDDPMIEFKIIKPILFIQMVVYTQKYYVVLWVYWTSIFLLNVGKTPIENLGNYVK